MSDQIDLLTEEQTAELLGIVPLTLCNWRSQRRGPPRVKIGRKTFYRREAIAIWIASREGVYRPEERRQVARAKQARGAGSAR